MPRALQGLENALLGGEPQRVVVFRQQRVQRGGVNEQVRLAAAVGVVIEAASQLAQRFQLRCAEGERASQPQRDLVQVVAERPDNRPGAEAAAEEAVDQRARAGTSAKWWSK